MVDDDATFVTPHLLSTDGVYVAVVPVQCVTQCFEQVVQIRLLGMLLIVHLTSFLVSPAHWHGDDERHMAVCQISVRPFDLQPTLISECSVPQHCLAGLPLVTLRLSWFRNGRY